MTSKIETLAQVYLQAQPVTISDETISEFCDWLMSEFQQLPLNVQFSDYMRYDTALEMFADIEQGHLWESVESYDSAIYPSPFYGFAFLAIHDYDHYQTGGDFTLEGEIAAYKFSATRVNSLEIQKILYSEIVLKSAAHIYISWSCTRTKDSFSLVSYIKIMNSRYCTNAAKQSIYLPGLIAVHKH